MVESTMGFLEMENTVLEQVYIAMKAKCAIAEGQQADIEAKFADIDPTLPRDERKKLTTKMQKERKRIKDEITKCVKEVEEYKSRMLCHSNWLIFSFNKSVVEM